MNVEYGAAPLDLDLTRKLCTYLSELRFEDLPEHVVHEAKRGLLDWVGCALAGSRYETISTLLAVLSAVSGKENSSVLGHKVKLGLLEAPIVNGQMGHLLDYDDTHMGGVVLHTSSPVLAALFALAEARQSSGKELLTAYVVGFEAGVRVGRSAPEHHDGGWHLTGTLGTIAAGISAARLIDLDSESTLHAAGIAATQSSGMQQNRGTMCKSFHAGRAASNGVLAALLAESGFDSSTEIVEGKRGFSRIYSQTQDLDALTANLGEEWIISSNGYKPYACGIVQHPLIDAMIALSEEYDIPAAQISNVEARVNPAMIRITGVEQPESGLKSKFSLKHSAAVSYLDRAAGVAQYSDAKAADPDVDALRRKIEPIADDSLRRDEADVSIYLADGRKLQFHVDHATGTADNPMNDQVLERKFMANSEKVLGRDRAAQVAELIWNFECADNIENLTALCRA